jgi:hypothetical protein
LRPPAATRGGSGLAASSEARRGPSATAANARQRPGDATPTVPIVPRPRGRSIQRPDRALRRRLGDRDLPGHARGQRRCSAGGSIPTGARRHLPGTGIAVATGTSGSGREGFASGIRWELRREPSSPLLARCVEAAAERAPRGHAPRGGAFLTKGPAPTEATLPRTCDITAPTLVQIHQRRGEGCRP